MSISKSCGNAMDNKNAEFEQLERRLFDHLYFKSMIIQELIDIAFSDLTDVVEIKNGNMTLREDAVIDSGIQVTMTKDSLKVTAPYKMKALDLLGKIYVLDEKENQLKVKIYAEQLKVKQMMQQINIEKNL